MVSVHEDHPHPLMRDVSFSISAPNFPRNCHPVNCALSCSRSLFRCRGVVMNLEHGEDIWRLSCALNWQQYSRGICMVSVCVGGPKFHIVQPAHDSSLRVAALSDTWSLPSSEDWPSCHDDRLPEIDMKQRSRAMSQPTWSLKLVESTSASDGSIGVRMWDVY